MDKLFINGYQIDLNEDRIEIPVTYEAAPIGDFPAASSFFSVEVSIPATLNNMKATGMEGMISTQNIAPFELLTCQFLSDGVDMKIDGCQVTGMTEEEDIRIRMFGGMASLLSLIDKKSIQDIDLSNYDHIRNYANISSNLQGDKGYVYPIIEYMDDITGNHIHIENMYPSIFLHSIFEQILTDAGWTMDGDLVNDNDYKSILLPYSNKQSEYTADYINALKSKMYLSTPYTTVFDALNLALFPFDLSSNDNFSLIYGLPLTYHALIKATYECDVKASIVGTPYNVITVSLWKTTTKTITDFFLGEIDIIDKELVGSWVASGSDFDTGTAVIDETVSTELNKGDVLFLGYSKQFGTVVFNEGSTTTYLEITNVTNYGVFIGDLWQVAPNLPAISQRDLLKYILTSFCCVPTVDVDNKVLTLKRFKNVVNNIDRDDWSDKLDMTDKPSIEFETKLAQLNHFIYTEEDGLIKPEGTDYTFAINNKNLEPEKDFYKAPFGATLLVTHFTDSTEIPRIYLLTDKLIPRILVYREKTLSHNIDLRLNNANQGSHTQIANPYFITPDKVFNLGWATSMIPRYSSDRINLLTKSRTLVADFRLTAADINQLDFNKPVWIDRYKSYFYKKSVVQFVQGRSTNCELIEI